MIIVRNLPRWTGTPSCYACGRIGAIRVMTVNPDGGAAASLVLCVSCEASLANKLDRRKQAAAFKQLGIKSKPWSPDND